MSYCTAFLSSFSSKPRKISSESVRCWSSSAYQIFTKLLFLLHFFDLLSLFCVFLCLGVISIAILSITFFKFALHLVICFFPFIWMVTPYTSFGDISILQYSSLSKYIWDSSLKHFTSPLIFSWHFSLRIKTIMLLFSSLFLLWSHHMHLLTLLVLLLWNIYTLIPLGTVCYSIIFFLYLLAGTSFTLPCYLFPTFPFVHLFPRLILLFWNIATIF